MDVCQEMRTEVELMKVTVIFSGETGNDPASERKRESGHFVLR